MDGRRWLLGVSGFRVTGFRTSSRICRHAGRGGVVSPILWLGVYALGGATLLACNALLVWRRLRILPGVGEALLFLLAWPILLIVFGVEYGKHASEDPRAENMVHSPVAGEAVTIHVSPGDRVVKGQDLVVIRYASGKECCLMAPRDGVVESVGCKEGASVGVGEMVVKLAHGRSPDAR